MLTLAPPPGWGRHPVIDGIPYLRLGRETLRDTALSHIAAGDTDRATAELLRDQDDFARTPPPPVESLLPLVPAVRRKSVTLSQALEALGYGPVADYFRLRPSVPTFLSGLALVSQYAGGFPVLELACGAGHFLRELGRFGIACAGVDVVFSKLWLARHFLSPDAQLVCADVCRPLPIGATEPVAAFCHDAFYFFPDKPAVASELKRLAGPDGRVLVGHVHTPSVDHGVAGTPITATEALALFPGATLHDDDDLGDAHLSGEPAARREPAALSQAEAIGWAWAAAGDVTPGRPDRFAVPPAGTALAWNPLVEPGRVRWPHERFAREYRRSAYLSATRIVERGTAGESAEVDALARRRLLLPAGDAR